MKITSIIMLVALLLVSCGKSPAENPAVSIDNDEYSYKEGIAVPTEHILWQRYDTDVEVRVLSENVISIADELYNVDNDLLAPLTTTVKTVIFSEEAVEICTSFDLNGILRYIGFDSANMDANSIMDNKAVVVDFSDNQMYLYDVITNIATPLLSDSAYGFDYNDYEAIAGKYETIVWFDTPTVNNSFEKIAYWSNKYVKEGNVSYSPGVWIVNLADGIEYRLDLGNLVPTVDSLSWLDDETLLFTCDDGKLYKFNITADMLLPINLESGSFVCIENRYAVYKTEDKIAVHDLVADSFTEYSVTKPVSFDKVFEKNGIVAFSSLKDGSIWNISIENDLVSIYNIPSEDSQTTSLKGWSKNGLLIETVDISENKVDKLTLLTMD